MSFNLNQRAKRSKFVSEINLTPLMDVLLVLLIIFMVTAPMLVSGIHVDLPEADNASIEGNDEPLTVTIDKNAIIYIQDQVVAKEALVAKLLAISQEKRDIRIFVRGDKNVDYGSVMNVVSEINQAGFTKITLLTHNI